MLIALGAQGVQRGGSRLPHAARDPVRLEPGQPRRDPRVRVRVRSRCGRRGVVDGDRPGGGRRGVPRRDPDTPRLGRDPPPRLGGDAAAAHRRPVPAAARRFDPRRVHRRHRVGRPRSTRRRSPPTRSPPRCSPSSP